MENNSQKVIIFKGKKDPEDVVMEILESNGLKENLDDYIDKIDKKQYPWFDILYKSAKNLAKEITTDTNFMTDTQKRLNVSERVAKNILKGIKEKFLPLVEIINEDEIGEEVDVETPIKSLERPIGVTEILSQMKNMNDITPPNSIPSISKTIRDTKKTMKRTNAEKLEIEQDITRQQKKDNDTYREPI